MSQSVDRLKELLFDNETLALRDLAQRIDAIADAGVKTRQDLLRRLETITDNDTKTRDDLTRRLVLIAESESRSRDDLARRIDGLADLDARARDELKAKLDDIYARAGNNEHLTRSVSEIISEALRRAEVERHAELSQSIAPLVVSTIKTELRNSQDEMVEALYPITGRLVKSYVASAIKDLTEQMNRRLEQNPVMLRLQSLTTGRPVGELALASTQDFQIKELYLIRRGSGELVAHWPQSATGGREHAMSGVLAAVNEFANEAFSATESSLRQIDLGGEEVYLRGSPIYLLAARCSGQAPKAIEQTIDDAFLLAVERQGAIDTKTPAGDDASAAKAAALSEVGQSLQSQVAAQIEDFRRPAGAGALKVLAALILLPIIGWYGWTWYTEYAIAQTRSAAERIIAADPAMIGYPVEITIARNGRELAISGLTPSIQAKTRIVTDLKQSLKDVTLTDKLSVVAGSGITVPDVSPELARVRQEISVAMTDVARDARVRANLRANARLQQASEDLSRAAPVIANRTRGDDLMRISTDLDAIRAELRPLADTTQAMATSGADDQHIAAYAALTRRLEGASNDLLNTIGAAAPDEQPVPAGAGDSVASVEAAVERFAAGSERVAALASAVAAANILTPPPPAPVAPVIQSAPLTPRQKLGAWTSSHAIFFSENLDYRNPEISRQWLSELAALLKPAGTLLRIVGYTDETGGTGRNVQLARDRADKVRADLIDLGVPPEALVAVGRADALDLSDTKGAGTPNRRVQFELGFEGEVQP